MIKRCTVDAVDKINDIMTHPDIYPDCTDDGSPRAMDFDISVSLECESIYHLAWIEDGVWKGLALLKPWNTITYETHVCVLPEFRGASAVQFGKDVIAWMFRNSKCRKIVAVLPETNKRALSFALSVGMKEEGFIKKSFLKSGKVLNQLLLGIEKGD